ASTIDFRTALGQKPRLARRKPSTDDRIVSKNSKFGIAGGFQRNQPATFSPFGRSYHGNLFMDFGGFAVCAVRSALPIAILELLNPQT
ncbi:MAG: hypothetical protein LBB86_00005, partial [Oscillospiraceae bacterium]|nr:hypothetical protein [Oscillospiraceae bacterium]